MSKETSLVDNILSDYQQVREFSQYLAADLSPEDQTLQSMPDASPVKWHLAHTTWFFETFILSQYQANFSWFCPAYCELFNSYYNAIGKQYTRAKRGLISRPGVEDIKQYREAIDSQLLRLFEQLPDAQREEVAQLIELGLNHEQQHQELLLTDIKHAFYQNPLFPAYRLEAGIQQTREQESKAATQTEWTTIKGGLVEIGADATQFCFDNELPHHQVFLEDYRLANKPVTNGEFLAFIENNGYRDPLIWLSDGWSWLSETKTEAPLYWYKKEERWFHFTLKGLQAINLDEPVCHINYYEADAYARWAGARLPTEAEWEYAAQRHAAAQNDTANLLDTGAPLKPLNGRNQNAQLQQMFGDVWEWTSSAYSAYPGFSANPGAVGEYNGKFMSGQMVLRGGSCVTPRHHIRATYRNFFPPQTQWQFSGLRLANA